MEAAAYEINKNEMNTTYSGVTVIDKIIQEHRERRRRRRRERERERERQRETERERSK